MGTNGGENQGVAIEIDAKFRMEEDVLQYICPDTTWRPKGSSAWRGSTSEWTPVSELASMLEEEVR
jgi:hypothetical protein